jgi:hypothetical protein
MNKLLKEAIADAKAVRETALANAKLALEEAFTPRLQSMLSAKLSEEEHMDDDLPMEEPAVEEDMHYEEETEAPMEEPAVEEGDEVEEPAVEEGEEVEAPVEAPAEEEDLELEAILRELEGEEEMDEQSDSSDIGTGDNKLDVADSSDEQDPGKGDLTEEEEDIDLEEIINALREDDDAYSEEGPALEEDEEVAAEEELEEAYKVIRFMKSKLNEVNLLNAKLLFSNKLFRNHNLNESQKMNVIENFDRAHSLREVKLVFATLSESFKIHGGQKQVKTIKESYASKASRSTRPSKSILSEGNIMADRFKKLAGLI